LPSAKKEKSTDQEKYADPYVEYGLKDVAGVCSACDDRRAQVAYAFVDNVIIRRADAVWWMAWLGRR
jgi:hypothetical protein